jgi:uncharacterized protein
MSQYKDSSHDYSHVNRVRKMALYLANEESINSPVDLELVELSALLHDVGDFKFLKPGETSESVLRAFMRDAQYSGKLQDSIIWISQRISFRHELEHGPPSGPHLIELSCVQDADRLEAIGAIGIARCFAYNGARNLALYDSTTTPLISITSQQYNQQKDKGSNARNHFYEKLLKLARMMKTDAGRKEAAHRHELLCTFISEFDRECGLDSSILSQFPSNKIE